MSNTVEALGALMRLALNKLETPVERRRPSTKAIYETISKLKEARQLLERRFGAPVKCRYPGCPPVSREGRKPRKVLGYLWDFSFSRFSIPEAIEQDGNVGQGRKYELLFVAESELGTEDEIARDLLKLLDARAAIRCLIYKEPRRAAARERQQQHLLRVLRNHRHYAPATDEWLFIGVSWGRESLSVEAYTLAVDGASLVRLPQTA